jgi:PAS domain S-box-containing protein
MRILPNVAATATSNSFNQAGHSIQQIYKKAANLDALVENLDGYVWSVDTEMRYIVLNNALLHLIKDVLNIDAKPGDKMLDLLGMLDPSKTSEWEEIYQQAFEGKGQRFISQFLIHEQPTFFEVSINPMRKGEVINGISCFARNVTEHIHNSRMLQESEIRFRSLIENSADFIMMANEEGCFVYGSPSVKRYLGYSDEEYLYKSVFTFIHPDSVPAAQKLLGDLSEHYGQPFTIYLKLIHKNGTEIWVEGIATNLLDTPGINALVGNFRDISERKKAERLAQESEYLRHQLMEEKINRQKEIMQAAIEAQEKERAHIGRELHDNVKQILSTAKVCLEYGRDNVSVQQHMMQRAEDIINTAINEIRELSKSLIQVYQREIGLQLSIENLVESIRIGNRFTIRIDFGIRDENQLDDQLKMTLFRIIQEQLNNILTHAEPKNINISLQQSGKVVSLCLSDDGKGFDVQHKRMGIGITNIINRAEIFNGQVNIQSSPGKGCRLQVSFSI